PNTYWKYSLTDVPVGQFDLTAFRWGFLIAPANFTNLLTVTGNLSSINFTSAPVVVAGSIVGRIVEQGQPLPGISVQAFSNSIPIGSGISDFDGYYSIDNLADGTYSIIPSASGYSFSPPQLSDVYAGTSDNDFIATGPDAPPVISLLAADPPIVPNAASN